MVCNLLFGKIHNIDVLQSSPIKLAVKSGAKFVEVTFDNDILYLVISVLITFMMLYAYKIIKSWP